MNNKITSLVIAGFFTLLSLPSFVMAHVGTDEYAHHSMMGGYLGSSMWVFSWILIILIIIALIVFITFMLKQIQGGGKR